MTADAPSRAHFSEAAGEQRPPQADQDRGDGVAPHQGHQVAGIPVQHGRADRGRLPCSAVSVTREAASSAAAMKASAMELPAVWYACKR